MAVLTGPAALAAMQQMIEGLQTELITLRTEMTGSSNERKEREKEYMDGIGKEFANHKIVMEEILERSRTEFRNIQETVNKVYENTQTKFEETQNNYTKFYEETHNKFNTLYVQTNEAVQRLDKKIDNMNNGEHGEHRREGGLKDYIPTKNLLPKTFFDKLEEWRSWQEEVEDYLYTLNPGVK